MALPTTVSCDEFLINQKQQLSHDRDTQGGFFPQVLYKFGSAIKTGSPLLWHCTCVFERILLAEDHVNNCIKPETLHRNDSALLHVCYVRILANVTNLFGAANTIASSPTPCTLQHTEPRTRTREYSEPGRSTKH